MMEIKEKVKLAKKLKVNYNKLNDAIDDLSFLKAKFSVSGKDMSIEEYREMRKLKRYINEVEEKKC